MAVERGEEDAVRMLVETGLFKREGNGAGRRCYLVGKKNIGRGRVIDGEGGC